MGYKIKRVLIWQNGEEKQIYPAEKPIKDAGIYWSSKLGVITFQTSSGVGISIADKNLGATQVYNSGDGNTFENTGYAYQWGNNYGWTAGVDATSTSTTKVNASNYGPGNYYYSSTFICSTIDNASDANWDSSNNANLWGGTTDTYAARRGPCDEGWHIPSSADCSTLVNAISSITGSVTGTLIKQYCKLHDKIPGMNRMNGKWDMVGAWGGIPKSDQRTGAYSGTRCGLLYLPTNGSYSLNDYYPKSSALPMRPFSNTFIQPMDTWTKLN